MSYKAYIAQNNNNLQIILDIVNSLSGGTTIENSSFIPSNSGSEIYREKLKDNNIDLQNLLNMALSLPNDEVFEDIFTDILKDFKYIIDSNGNAVIIDWKGTYNGNPSTEIIIPYADNIIL